MTELAGRARHARWVINDSDWGQSVGVAVGETVIFMAPPCTFSRCFNREKQAGGGQYNDSLAGG